MPENKEPSLFLDHYGYTSWDEYVELFRAANRDAVRGEASAGYLAAPESPERIHRALPNAKLIIILRDPAQRAFSAWCWMVMEGYEPIAVFADALDAEERRLHDPAFKTHAPQYFMDYLYFHVGLYADQIERYLKLFDKDQMKIFLFDDLVESPRHVYEECCRFINVKTLSDIDLSAKNVSVVPWSVKIQYRIRQLNLHTLRHSERAYSSRLAMLTRNLMTKNLDFGARPVRDPVSHARLRQRYQEPNMRLSQLIGRDLSAWA